MIVLFPSFLNYKDSPHLIIKLGRCPLKKGSRNIDNLFIKRSPLRRYFQSEKLEHPLLSPLFFYFDWSFCLLQYPDPLFFYYKVTIPIRIKKGVGIKGNVKYSWRKVRDSQKVFFIKLPDIFCITFFTIGFRDRREKMNTFCDQYLDQITITHPSGTWHFFKILLGYNAFQMKLKS